MRASGGETRPEGKQWAQQTLVQAFAAEAPLSQEDEAALDMAYAAVAEGRTHPFDPERARRRAEALLRPARES